MRQEFLRDFARVRARSGTGQGRDREKFAGECGDRHRLDVKASRDDSAPQATWFDLDDHGGVLDLEGLKLSLFVVVPFPGATKSWWTTEDGTWLMSARVGLA